VLAGGKLNATAPETGNNHIGLRCRGIITTTGTLITAKGGSKAIEIEKNNAFESIIVADVVVVSETYSGTGKKALSIGGHTSEELASYRYAEAGNRSELGFEPTKRSLSEAVITLTETLTYNGSEQTQGFTVNVAEVELTAGEHFTVTGEKATDVGTYCITLTAKDGTDYTGTVTKEYTINKKKINATVTVTITGGPYVYVEGGVVPPDANVIVTYDGAVLVKDKDYYYYSVNGNRVGSGTDGGYILVAAAPEGNYDFYQSTGYYTIVKGTNPAVVQSSTIVGVGKQNELSSLVSGYDETPEFEIIGETLGCIITWNGGFTAGTSVGEVKVQVTFEETSYYHSRTEIITVTVVEEGGVYLWGYVTGSTEDKVTLQLLQDSVVKYETTIPGNNAERYFIYGVAAGTYTLRARKENHLDYETTVVIGNDNLQANVDFKYDYIIIDSGATYNVRLIEPWALRVNVRFKDGEGITIPVENLVTYGAYAVRASLLSSTEDVTIEQIINDSDTIHFSKGTGEGKMFPKGDGRATFDFSDKLYTFRLSEDIYWVAYYVDEEGITYYTKVRTKALHTLMNDMMATVSDEEADVYEKMLTMESAIKAYRAGDISESEVKNAATVDTCGIRFGDAITDGKYAFGRSYRISLIEPWGIMLNTRIHDTTDADNSSSDHIDYAAADNYGVIVFHDKDGSLSEVTDYSDLLELEDAYVYSKNQGNISVDDTKVSVIFNKDIFTYELNSNIYCVTFLEVDGEYYYSAMTTRNLYDLMTTKIQTAESVTTEIEIYQAMVDMYDSITVYRANLSE